MNNNNKTSCCTPCLNNILSVLLVVFFGRFFVDGHPGWSPMISGWYPHLTFSENELAQVVSSWEPCDGRVWERIPSTGWASLHEVSDPSALVLQGSGSVSINYVDDSWLMSVPVENILCVPPYKPVSYILFRGSIAAYRLRQSPSADGNCSFIQSTCKLPSALPRKVQKPVHEFFFTASHRPHNDELTLLTCGSTDRLLRIRQIAEIYQGPISAAIFLINKDELKEDFLKLESYYLKYPIMQKYVDIHIVFEDGIYLFKTADRPFPINILRTTALRYARTNYVMYIEADFVPNLNFKDSPSLLDIKSRLNENPKQVFIVFGLITNVKELCDWNVDITTVLPSTKQDLINNWIAPNVDRGVVPLDRVFASHQPISYEVWKKAESIYSFEALPNCEPYYIGTRDYPTFGEIMIGCGRDKIVHYEELILAGYSFWIVHDLFIIHLDSTGMGSAWCQGFGSDFPKDEVQKMQASWSWSQSEGGNGFKGQPLLWWDATESVLVAKNNTEDVNDIVVLKETQKEDSNAFDTDGSSVDKVLARMSREQLLFQLQDLQSIVQKIRSERNNLREDAENTKSNFKLFVATMLVLCLMLTVYGVRRKTILWTVLLTVVVQLTFLILVLALR